MNAKDAVVAKRRTATAFCLFYELWIIETHDPYELIGKGNSEQLAWNDAERKLRCRN